MGQYFSHPFGLPPSKIAEAKEERLKINASSKASSGTGSMGGDAPNPISTINVSKITPPPSPQRGVVDLNPDHGSDSEPEWSDEGRARRKLKEKQSESDSSTK